MQGIKRKLVYVALFETIGIAVTSVVFALFSGQPVIHASPLAVACAAIAAAWNVAWNTLFEAWERRQAVKGRGVARRVMHALGFEGMLNVFLVPLIAWWLSVSLWRALAANLGVALFFLVYTFVFTWVFDRVFGLPR
jgi:uncharacterized membrane protein